MVNYGTIAGAGYTGIDFYTSGSVTNLHGATTSGPTAMYFNGAAGTVVNSGYIGSTDITGQGRGIYLGDGGAITNLAGGTITSSGGAAINGYAAPTVVNSGYIADNGLGDAIYLRIGGSVTNLGTGRIASKLAGVAIRNVAGIVVNDATIMQTGSAGSGITLQSGGAVTNQSGGTITGQYGVKITGGSATVVNAGGITGSADAVLLASGFTDRLVVDPGAVFSGKVDGGNTIGAAHVSTLELASAATAGTLAGLGTQFIDFAQTMIDSSASWTLTSATIVAGATLANAGSVSGYVTLEAGSYLLNQATGTITGGAVITGSAARVTNLGSILSASDAVSVQAAGTIVNGSTTDTTALISGSAVGVIASAAGGSVSNYGTIFGGSFAGIFAAGGAWTISNGSTTNTVALI